MALGLADIRGNLPGNADGRVNTMLAGSPGFDDSICDGSAATTLGATLWMESSSPSPKFNNALGDRPVALDIC